MKTARSAALILLIVGGIGFLNAKKIQGQTPVAYQSEYLCDQVKDYDPGMCLVPIEGDGEGPLVNRIPVILIHGWNSREIYGEPDVEVWRGLVRHLYQNQKFRENFKIYFLLYWSNIQSGRDMGLTFANLVGRMDQSDPDFKGKPLVLVGYSMGGLVARSFMKEPRFGLRGLPGERVLRLITLGTPHHGTPLANGPIRDNKAGWWAEFLHKFVDGDLFGRDIRWYMDNRFDLRWDNYDGLFSNEELALENSNLWLEWLNSGKTFKDKIIAYGGIIELTERLDDCFLKLFSDSACLATITHKLFSKKGGDGVVPLDSAVFYPCKHCTATKIYSDYSHSEIVAGKFRLFWWEEEPLFEDIANDLLALVMLVESKK